MQKQKVPKRTFEEIPKPDIYKSYRHPIAATVMRGVAARRRGDALPRRKR